MLALVAVTAVATAAATRVRSREQAAAEREPPPRSVLTATVERRVLVDTIVARSTVTTEATVTVPVPDLPDGSRPTITAAPARRSDPLDEGAVAFEVAGRPVIVLLGAMPAFRSLVPGDRGDDVAQLQAALERLGYENDDELGAFGPSTGAAVGALYTARGYGAIEHLGGGPSGRTDALEAVQDAEDALAEAEAAGDPARIGAADRRLDAARDAVRAVDEASGPSVPFGEVVFVPALPARIGDVGAGMGATATDSLGTLRAGRLRFEARIDPDDGGHVALGDEATIHDDVTGATLSATVGDIGPTESDPDTAIAFRRVLLEPTGVVEQELLGRDLRLTIEGSSTDERVLVVPLTAISNGPDGTPRIERVEASGTVRSVPVLVGMSADGFAEVEPVSGSLAPGDHVVVGR